MMKRKQNLCLFLAVICLLALAFPAYAESESIPLTESTNQNDSGTGSAPVDINETNFPDSIFRNYVSTNFDSNSDGTLSAGEIANVTAIDITPKSDTSEFLNITSLQGIKCFTNLEKLTCGGYNSAYGDGKLSSLDVSGCTSLTTLTCYKGTLTTLNVSGCTSLKTLKCYNNKLTSLDVSGCEALTQLDCSANKLTTLDLNGCASLIRLDCYSNQLTELDVSDCAALQYLACYYNRLTALDVSANTALETLNFRDNSLTNLDISNTAVTNLLSNDNEREIVTDINTFDLSELPGFDVSKVSEVEGGEIKNGIIMITAEADENGYSTVKYSYDVGKENSVTFKIKFVACKHLTWKEATCTEPRTCVNCGKTEGEAKGHTVEIIPGKAATATETGLTTGKKCTACEAMLVEQRVIPINSTDITVDETALSDNAYTAEGPVVTVTYTQPCKVGYLEGNGNYAAIPADQNGDGSYSFIAPEGVTKVTIVITGDINGNGEVDSSDVTQLKAAFLEKRELTAVQKFAGDIDDKDGIAGNDVTQLKAAFLEKRELTW